MINCLNCYWSEWTKCEINKYINENGRVCMHFLNDKSHSKFIKEKLETEPEWCIKNWHLLDRVDKRKYMEMNNY